MKKLYLLAAAALCAATATAANGDVTDGWLMLEDFEGATPEMTAFNKDNGNIVPGGTFEIKTMEKDGNASNHALQFTPAGSYSHGIQIKATLPAGKTIADYTDISFDICGVGNGYKPLKLFINGAKVIEENRVIEGQDTWSSHSYAISVSGEGNEITIGFYNETSNTETIAFDNIQLKEKDGGSGENPDPDPTYDASKNGTVTDGWLMIEDYQTKKPGDEVTVKTPDGGQGKGAAKIEVDSENAKNLTGVFSVTDGDYNTIFALNVKLPEGKTLKDYEKVAFDLYRFSDDDNNKQMLVMAGTEQIYLDLKDNGEPNYVEQAPETTWTPKEYAINEATTVGNTFTLYFGIKTNKGHYAVDNIRLHERKGEIQPGASQNGIVTDGWLMVEDFEATAPTMSAFTTSGGVGQGKCETATIAKDDNNDNKVGQFTAGGNWSEGIQFEFTLPEGKTIADYTEISVDIYGVSGDVNWKDLEVYVDGSKQQGKVSQAIGNGKTWKTSNLKISATGTDNKVKIGFYNATQAGAVIAYDNIRLKEAPKPELALVGEPEITIKHGTGAGIIIVSYSFELKNYNEEEIKVVASVEGLDVEFEEYVAKPANVPALAANENKTFSGNLKAQHEELKNKNNKPNVTLTATAGDKQLFTVTKAPDTTTGIEDVTVDSEAPVEYFNLQGLRVAQPEAGRLYIKRQGDKAVKVRF